MLLLLVLLLVLGCLCLSLNQPLVVSLLLCFLESLEPGCPLAVDFIGLSPVLLVNVLSQILVPSLVVEIMKLF
jgi:hypothetical protein